MSSRLLTSPIKCQGIKTKLVPEIKSLISSVEFDRWIEPFCGSCVVALNLQPRKATLADTNVHLVRFYEDIQRCIVTPGTIKEFLIDQGEKLRTKGQTYYYEVRQRFNSKPNSFDFLFLNRACFNGVMRFNRQGHFNVPFCRKIDRFSQSYVTKIVNQVRAISAVIHANDWTFEVAGFQKTLKYAHPKDLIYADPPYTGRHVDYFNSWSETDENELVSLLKHSKNKFILSTWHSNEFRRNPLMARNWSDNDYHLFTKEHYYHVGPSEDLRHPMVEALITNFPSTMYQSEERKYTQLTLLEQPFATYSVG